MPDADNTDLTEQLAKVRAAGERLADIICEYSDRKEDDVIEALKQWGRVHAIK